MAEKTCFEAVVDVDSGVASTDSVALGSSMADSAGTRTYLAASGDLVDHRRSDADHGSEETLSRLVSLTEACDN